MTRPAAAACDLLQVRRAAPAAALLAWTPPSCKCPVVAMWWQPLLPLMQEPMWASPELGGILLPSTLLCMALMATGLDASAGRGLAGCSGGANDAARHTNE